MKMNKVFTSILLISVFVIGINISDSRTASADPKHRQNISMIVLDGSSVNSTENTPDLVSSFIGLLATLHHDDLFLLMNTNDTSKIFGPYNPKDPQFKDARTEFESIFRWPTSIRPDDITTAIVEVQSALSEVRATSGSQVYLMLGDSNENNFTKLTSSLSPLINRMTGSGWILNGVSLPGVSDQETYFLDSISSISGGTNYTLNNFNELSLIADTTLSNMKRDNLSEINYYFKENKSINKLIGSETVLGNQVMRSVVFVEPGASKSTILMFRDKPYGSFQLINPVGLEVVENKTDVNFMEFPNVVIWELNEPVPGNWTVDADGIQGSISMWSYSSPNNYEIALENPSILPTDTPVAISAYVIKDEKKVTLDRISINTTVTGPNTYIDNIEMRDDGIAGDQFKGDGIYTMTLEPTIDFGEYTIEFHVNWLDLDHSFSSIKVVEFQPYPSIRFESLGAENISPKVKTLIGNAFVELSGNSFPVDPELLIPVLNSSNAQIPNVEIIPKQIQPDGLASQYDVFVTLPTDGSYSVSLQIMSDYLGNPFSNLTKALALRSKVDSDLTQVAKTFSKQKSVNDEISKALETNINTISIADESSEIPWDLILVSVGMFSLIVIGGMFVYFRLQTRPFGYIYNDIDEPLVDFSNIERNWFERLVNRNKVSGKTLGIPGLEGVTFSFSGRNIRMFITGKKSSVRVNNQPLVGRTTIDNRAWIGSKGKLYTFFSIKPSVISDPIVN